MSSTGHLSEVESLRSQMADLTRALAGRDQSMRAQSHHLEETMRDLREQSHLLRTTIEGTAAETGDESFASLVTHLTPTLPVQYAVIGEVLEGQIRKSRTFAVSAGGTLVDNFEYELAHTPCASALTQMQLSDKTVKNYLANIFQKLHISRRAQAATFFVRRQA